MPIKSLQVTQSSVHEGLSCIGKIRKGAPKTPQGTVGKDLDHFRFTAEPEFAGAERVFADLYGPEPTFFDPVFIIGDTVEEAFNPWMEEWKATALLHRCDEETQVLSYNAQTEMYIRAHIPCVRADGGQCGCKPVGRLSLLMPELMIKLGVSGYVSVETHSVNDILSLQHALNAAVAMTGRITGVAFIFGRAPEKISARIVDKQGNARRVNTTKSLFFLRPNEDYTRNNLLPELAAAGNRPLFGNGGERWRVLELTDGTGAQPPLPGTARERLEGNKPASRRLVGPAPSAPAQPPAQPQPAPANEPETVEGEVVDDEPKRQSSPAGTLVGPKWSAGDARKWSARQHLHGLSESDLFKALDVESFDQFEGSMADADARLADYIKAQIQKQEQTA